MILKNGVNLIVEKREHTQTVSLTLMIKGGLFRENSNNYGIGELFSNVWLRSNDILDSTEYYGGAIYTSISNDYSEMGFSVVTEFAHKILHDLDIFINSPKFDDKVFEIEKNIQLNRIKSSRDNANSVAAIGFNKATYGNFVYSQETFGTMETVSKIGLNDLRDYYKNLLKGKDIIVSVAGNFDDKLLDEIKNIFEKVPDGESSFVMNCEGSEIKYDNYVVEEHDRIKQAKLFIGYNAPSANDKNYHAIKLLSDILGGGMSSKYFNILRKDKGYAYAVGSFYPSRLCSSRFVAYIGLQYENVEDAIKTMDSINKNIVQYISEADLEANKNYILGKVLSEAQTNSKISWYNAFFTNLGLGTHYLNKYIEIIKSLTIEDILRGADIFKKPKTIYVLKPKESK
ncbi:MAG: insulinase family protein [Deferribacterales bacterium]